MTVDLKSPQQQIFDMVFLQVQNLGYDVYDYLPAKSAKLPFAYVGEQFDQDRQNKSTITGDVQQTIHIYGGHKQRRRVSSMIDNLKRVLREIKNTENFNVRVKSIDGQIMIDNLTSTTLIHGIVEVEFVFN